MADIINTPARNDNGGTVALVGGIVLVIVALLLIFYSFPGMRGVSNNPGSEAQPETQVQQAPDTGGGDEGSGDGGSMQFPDEINVNVNQPSE